MKEQTKELDENKKKIEKQVKHASFEERRL